MPDPVLSSILRINRQRLRALRLALTPYQYVGNMHLIVSYTFQHPGASQEEIAAFYALDKTSLARSARRLEDMGHIRREINPHNRRQYRLYLTEAGAKIIPVIHEAYDKFAATLAEGISPEEWQQLKILLEKLEANCECRCCRK